MSNATRQLASHTVREEDQRELRGNAGLILIMIMTSFRAAEVEGDKDFDA